MGRPMPDLASRFVVPPPSPPLDRDTVLVAQIETGLAGIERMLVSVAAAQAELRARAGIAGRVARLQEVAVAEAERAARLAAAKARLEELLAGPTGRIVPRDTDLERGRSNFDDILRGGH